MSFTPATIRIRTADGFKEEQAIVSGPFAIHQTRYKDWTLVEGAWTLTHIPSGYCITHEATSEQAARTLMAALEPLTDWNVIDLVPAIKGDAEKLAALKTALQIAVNTTCWLAREDVDPEYVGAAYVACEHAICLEDIRLHKLGYDHWSSHWDCPSGVCYLDRSQAECTLEPGHDGAHQWEEVGPPRLNEWVSLPTPKVAEPVS